MSTFWYLRYTTLNSFNISMPHMSKRRFTPEEIANLLKNKNVVKCSDKTISYSKEFKVKAVKMYLDEGISPNQIFLEEGFDLNVIGWGKPNDCVGDWRRIFKIKGVDGLLKECRGRLGGRPKSKGLNDTDKIEYLEAKVAYLTAENDFLTKLRAKRAE